MKVVTMTVGSLRGLDYVCQNLNLQSEHRNKGFPHIYKDKESQGQLQIESVELFGEKQLVEALQLVCRPVFSL